MSLHFRGRGNVEIIESGLLFLLLSCIFTTNFAVLLMILHRLGCTVFGGVFFSLNFSCNLYVISLFLRFLFVIIDGRILSGGHFNFFQETTDIEYVRVRGSCIVVGKPFEEDQVQGLFQFAVQKVVPAVLFEVLQQQTKVLRCTNSKCNTQYIIIEFLFWISQTLYRLTPAEWSRA